MATIERTQNVAAKAAAQRLVQYEHEEDDDLGFRFGLSSPLTVSGTNSISRSDSSNVSGALSKPNRSPSHALVQAMPFMAWKIFYATLERGLMELKKLRMEQQLQEAF